MEMMIAKKWGWKLEGNGTVNFYFYFVKYCKMPYFKNFLIRNIEKV